MGCMFIQTRILNAAVLLRQHLSAGEPGIPHNSIIWLMFFLVFLSN